MLDVELRISVLLPYASVSAASKLRRVQITVRLGGLNIDLLTAFVVIVAASF